MDAQSNKIVNRSMPPGTIIVELGYEDVETAVTWLCHTFGFKERLRIGNHRSQLIFGEASIVVVAQSRGRRSQTAEANAIESEIAHSMMVQLADVNRHFEHAKQCGAHIVNPPTDYPYGERQYTAEDLTGRRWTFSQSIADVDPQEWGGILFEV